MSDHNRICDALNALVWQRTGPVFAQALRALELSQRDAAALLGVAHSTAARWSHGRGPVEDGVWDTLRALLLDALAAPEGTALGRRSPGAPRVIELDYTTEESETL